MLFPFSILFKTCYSIHFCGEISLTLFNIQDSRNNVGINSFIGQTRYHLVYFFYKEKNSCYTISLFCMYKKKQNMMNVFNSWNIWYNWKIIVILKKNQSHVQSTNVPSGSSTTMGAQSSGSASKSHLNFLVRWALNLSAFFLRVLSTAGLQV